MGDAKIRITSKNDAAKGIDAVKSKLKSLKRFADSVSSGLKTSFKIIGASIGSLIGVGTLMTKSYIESEKAELDLAAAIRNTGGDVDKMIPKYKEYAASIQKATLYEDDQIISLMALATNMGVAEDQLTNTMTAAVGLASAYRIDLETAVELLSKAYNGNTTALKRYGITLDKNIKDSEKFGAIIKIASKGMAFAEAETKTLSGSLIKAKIAWGELLEAGGLAIAQNLDLAGIIERLTNKINELAQNGQLKQWIVDLSETMKNMVILTRDLVSSLEKLKQYRISAKEFFTPPPVRIFRAIRDSRMNNAQSSDGILVSINDSIKKQTEETRKLAGR